MPESKPDEISFEEALRELETVVAEMETPDIPLTRLIETYEKGAALLKICQTRLGEAEMKIELVRKQEADSGEIETEPLTQAGEDGSAV